MDGVNPDAERLEAMLRESARLSAHLVPRAFAAGEHVFRQDARCRDIFVLRSGLVKLYYVTRQGKEWIKSFIADRGAFGSRVAQVAGAGSAYSAVCLEDSSVLALPYRAFWEAAREHPALMEAALAFSERLGLKKERREYDLLCRSAEDRYREFIGAEKAVAGRLTQADIARYLGITPIALSRIKKRLGARSSATKKPDPVEV